MNITEVMGLWDSFITLTNTISQGGLQWEDRTAMCLPLFALHNRLLNSFTPLPDF